MKIYGGLHPEDYQREVRGSWAKDEEEKVAGKARYTLGGVPLGNVVVKVECRPRSIVEVMEGTPEQQDRAREMAASSCPPGSWELRPS